MFKHILGRFLGNTSGENEVETRLSRREMLGVTGLFLLTAPAMLRPSVAAARVIKPAPVAEEPALDVTNVPFNPAEDEAEVVNVRHNRRHRRAQRRQRRRRARIRRRRRHYGRSQWRRRRRRSSPDFCVWGPWGGFCVD